MKKRIHQLTISRFPSDSIINDEKGPRLSYLRSIESKLLAGFHVISYILLLNVIFNNKAEYVNFYYFSSLWLTF